MDLQTYLDNAAHALRDDHLAKIGKTFTGYKGGDFEMSRRTPVWVANYGNAGNTGIVGIHDDGYSVIILTAYIPDQL